jgi:hypothetical protein
MMLSPVQAAQWQKLERAGRGQAGEVFPVPYEPMFVQPCSSAAPMQHGKALQQMMMPPQAAHGLSCQVTQAPHAAAGASAEQLAMYSQRLDQLRQVSAALNSNLGGMVASGSGAGLTTAEGDVFDEQLGRYAWQLEQLQRASTMAMAQAPKAVARQDDFGKLTQSIATLSAQLSRFEVEMQQRVSTAESELIKQVSMMGLGASGQYAYTSPMQGLGGPYAGEYGLLPA